MTWHKWLLLAPVKDHLCQLTAERLAGDRMKRLVLKSDLPVEHGASADLNGVTEQPRMDY